MRTSHQMGRALRSGAGLALVAALALVNAHASADPVAALTSGIHRCSVRGAAGGSLAVKPDGICTRYPATLPGADGLYCRGNVCASCLSVSRKMGCLLLSPDGVPLDLPAGTHIYNCTMAGGGVASSLVVKPDGTCRRYATTLSDASDEYCDGGACPSCWALGRDLGCVTGE